MYLETAQSNNGVLETVQSDIDGVLKTVQSYNMILETVWDNVIIGVRGTVSNNNGALENVLSDNRVLETIAKW